MYKNLFTLFVICFLSIVSVNAQKNAADKSLIVSYCLKAKFGCPKLNIEKLDFSSGKLVSRKIITVFDDEKDGTPLDFRENRYIWTSNDKIFDLIQRKFVEMPKSFLKTRPESPLQISPDGKTTLVFEGSNRTERLEIKREGEQSVFIDESFEATISEISSIIPYLPYIWIDNDRFLIQKRNGTLFLGNIEGKIEPFLELPCGSDQSTALKKTKAGKIIYLCTGDNYAIDVANKSFKKSMEDLDNDFYVDYKNRESNFYS